MSDAFEIWRIKKLLKVLLQDMSYGRILVSVAIPPGDSISRFQDLLTDKYLLAKEYNHHPSVCDAIILAKKVLSVQHGIPENGLMAYAGTLGEYGDHKQRNLSALFIPLQPVRTPLCTLHYKFDIQPLKAFVGDTLGFIIMDKNASIFGTLWGNERKVICTCKFNKRPIRVALREPEKYHKDLLLPLENAEMLPHFRLMLTNDLAEEVFIDEGTDKPTVAGLIIARSTEIKTEQRNLGMTDPTLQAASESGILYPNLQDLILNVVDISHGGEEGFREAINKSSQILVGFKYLQEVEVLRNFFREFAKGSGKCIYGMEDSLEELQKNNIETLIVADIPKNQLLLEWVYSFYNYMGCKVEIVSDGHREGNQFAKAFNGIGCILLEPNEDLLEETSDRPTKSDSDSDLGDDFLELSIGE